MSSHGGAAANQVSDRIKTGIDAVIAEDRFNSQHGFGPHREKTRKDLTREEIERMRSPETIVQILDGQDADAKLLRDLLCERRGLRGVGRRIGQSFVGKAAGTLAVGYATRGAAHAGLHFASEIAKNSSAAAMGTAVGTIAPYVPVLMGTASGGFWAWIRGKNQEYSAATWLQNLDILSASEGEIEDMPDEQLFTALGLLKNAIDKGGIRGKSIHKLEMVAKYNQIKNLLRQRVIEARQGSGELNPVLARLDAAIDGSRREGRNLSEAAGAEMKSVYEKLTKLKRKKVRNTVIKGAVIGGTIGAALNITLGIAQFLHLDNVVDAIQNSSYVQRINEWVEGHAQNAAGSMDLSHVAGAHDVGVGIGDAPHDGGMDMLHQKMEALRGDELSTEIADHNANLEYFHGYRAMDPSLGDGTAPSVGDPPLGLFEGGGNSPFNHMYNLSEIGGHVDGFSVNHADLSHFQELLRAGDSHSMVEFAAHNNVDLTSLVHNDQPLSQFLLDNRESFLQLSPDAQNFVLSHPSIADQFIGAVQQKTPEALYQWLGMVMDKAGTVLPQWSSDQWNTAIGVGVGVVGAAAFAGANAGKKKAEARIGDLVNGAMSQDREAMIAWRKEQETAEQERREQRLETVRAELVDSRIIFNPALLTKLGYAIPSSKRKNEFVVDRVDEDGRILFMYTEKDLNMVRSGVAPHPKVTVDDIVDADNRINRDMLVICEAGSKKDASASVDTEELDLKEFDPFLSRNNMYGIVKKKNGRSVFVLDSAVNGRKELLIDIPAVESAIGILPNNTRYKADFNQVKDAGGEPQFGGNLSFESSGESFYIGSVYSGYQPKAKDPLIQEMKSVNAIGVASNIILYLSPVNLYCQFKGITPTNKFEFDILDNSGTVIAGPPKEIEETDLKALQIVKFAKK